MAERVPPPPPALPTDYKHDPSLTPHQKDMLDFIITRFSESEYTLPGADDSKARLMEEEKFWLSEECLLRYLRASKWNRDTAVKRLEDTLKWRRQFGLYDKLTTQHVEPEALTGKLIVYGYDVNRKVGFHMHPSRQNTPEGMGQMEFTVWMIERCIDLMGPGVETLVILLDYADKAKNPSFGHSKLFLNIFQSHYPERLGYALILNVPFLLNAFFKLVSPFIDPATRAKMIFNPQAVKDGYFAADAITKPWGGEKEFVWDHDAYWPALDKMCYERRATWMGRWRELGATVGIKEWDYKRGSEFSATA